MARLNISEILAELDRLFAAKELDKVEEFLLTYMSIAGEQQDLEAALTLENECIGFYRSMCAYDKAIESCSNAMEIIKKMGLTNTAEHATTLLNIATAYRAAGLLPQARSCYEQVEQIYEKTMPKKDYRYASLYNNKSILYQETGDYQAAYDMLMEARNIIKDLSDAKIELAVTDTNIGMNLLKMERIKEARESLLRAAEIFEKQEIRDYHYSACANALATLYFQEKEYEKAVGYYETALSELEKNVGKNKDYEAIKENLKLARKKAGQYESMMDLCYAYYEAYGKQMIQEKFPAYQENIAVGLVGEGSECFGFDDAISLDHDCGPGFCMWMTEAVYKEIGEELQREYEKLPKEFAGKKRINTKAGKSRVGVKTIEAFYREILGSDIPVTQAQWETIPEEALAAATNGSVFRDDAGIFTGIRNRLLSYYPDNVWYRKIAYQLAKVSQEGQYNYGRMMQRGEYVTGKMSLYLYIQDMLRLVYLLNRKYAPYYKWLHKGAKNLAILPEVGYIVTAIGDMEDQREAWKAEENSIQANHVNEKDNIALTMEIIADLVVQEMKKQGLTTGNDLYLETHMQEVLSKVKDVMTQIIQMEWESFDKVRGEGGRAGCQDDWETFEIMRKSQYMAWPKEMLESYLADLKAAAAAGRNLIEEKYAHMMESTEPERYKEFSGKLPVILPERKAIMEEVIAIQVAWMEEFAENYPKLAANARTIHTKDDTAFDTSYETYLRGELKTYSEETFVLYARFIVDLCKKNKNLAVMIMENTVKLYGYESLDQAEKR